MFIFFYKKNLHVKIKYYICIFISKRILLKQVNYKVLYFKYLITKDNKF